MYAQVCTAAVTGMHISKRQTSRTIIAASQRRVFTLSLAGAFHVTRFLSAQFTRKSLGVMTNSNRRSHLGGRYWVEKLPLGRSMYVQCVCLVICHFWARLQNEAPQRGLAQLYTQYFLWGTAWFPLAFSLNFFKNWPSLVPWLYWSFLVP